MKEYKVKDIGYSRFYSWDNPPKSFEVCSHISVVGELQYMDESCEYTSEIYIKCHICKKTYLITELIN